MRRPIVGEYGLFYQPYIDLTNGEDHLKVLKESGAALTELLENLNEEQWDYSYDEGKWTIRQLVQHIMDADLVFLYRAMSVARGDKTFFPGFDENAYAEASKESLSEPKVLIRNFKALRQFIIYAFESFGESSLENLGMASNAPVSPLALAFIIGGHTLHHINILEERYLSKKR